MNECIDFKSVCRICLKNKSEVISIFDNTPYGILFSEMLQECTSVFVSHNDLISKNICIECSEQLQIYYKFKLQCISSDHCLKDHAENDQTSKSNVYIIFDNESNSVENNTDYNIYEMTEENVSIDEIFTKTGNSDNEVENNSDSESNLNRTEKNSFQCEECGIEFQLETDFIRHMRNEHKKDSKKCFGNTYTCNICHKVYSAEWGLQKHLVSHGQCKYCEQRFDDDTKFKQHIEDHKRLGYSCNECGKRFKNFVRLRIHRQVNCRINFSMKNS